MSASQKKLLYLSQLFLQVLCPQEPRAWPSSWICSSGSLLSRKALLRCSASGARLGKRGCGPRVLTGMRAPQGQASVSVACGLVWRVFFFFFSCRVRLSPFEPPVPFSSWPRWKGTESWLSHRALFSSIAKTPSGCNMHVMAPTTVTGQAAGLWAARVPCSTRKEMLMATQQAIWVTRVTVASPLRGTV